MKREPNNILGCCAFVGMMFLICSMLFGCTSKPATVQIGETIAQNAQDAKKVISGTTSLEQCKTASVAQINALVRQANDAIAACQAEVTIEKKDVRFWFWAFIAACAWIFILAIKCIKGAVKV